MEILFVITPIEPSSAQKEKMKEAMQKYAKQFSPIHYAIQCINLHFIYFQYISLMILRQINGKENVQNNNYNNKDYLLSSNSHP